jgi:hypothetical protein
MCQYGRNADSNSLKSSDSSPEIRLKKALGSYPVKKYPILIKLMVEVRYGCLPKELVPFLKNYPPLNVLLILDCEQQTKTTDRFVINNLSKLFCRADNIPFNPAGSNPEICFTV